MLYITVFFDIMKNINVKLFFFSLNKVNKFIKVQNNILLKFFNKIVVYKIPYKDCDALYVSQTSRKLSTRISEHCNINSSDKITDLVLIMNLIGRMSKFLIRKNFSINVWIHNASYIWNRHRMHYSYAFLLVTLKQLSFKIVIG